LTRLAHDPTPLPILPIEEEIRNELFIGFECSENFSNRFFTREYRRKAREVRADKEMNTQDVYPMMVARAKVNPDAH
jgi:hypothetical protein